MKMKTSKLLELLLALAIIPTLVIPVTLAVKIPPGDPMTPGGPQNPSVDPISWEIGGLNANNSLPWNPEWLKLYTETPIHSETTIIVQGLDTYYQNVEAKVVIPAGTDQSRYFILNDTHTSPQQPVTFAKITGIFQQNGTHCNAVKILTHNSSWQQYIGRYTTIVGFKPGVGPTPWPSTSQYLVAVGAHTMTPYYHPTAIYQNVPVEPVNPEPLKIVTNWQDLDSDAQIDPNELTNPQDPGKVIWIEGLDEHGVKMIVGTTINDNTNVVNAGSHTWSTVCKVWGGGQDEYYIFTHPMPQRALFKYFIRIHHMSIAPLCYDILANPSNIGGAYPGVTDITVALRDVDDHLIHAPIWDNIVTDPNAGPFARKRNVTINFYTSGGKIQPSYDVQIQGCHVTATVNLTADTNARTVKVVADANIPPCLSDSVQSEPLNLIAWTELTFDGINSVPTGGVVIHPMEWGWETYNWNGTILYDDWSGFVPPKPPLPEWLGGPSPTSLVAPWKLDGPIYEVQITLHPGCNLISIPVHPFLCNTYWCEAWPKGGQGGFGIPMELIFGQTSATDTIEVIWWYNANSKTWDNYVPGVTTGKNLTDGIGYWVKAEKPCTLEISGVEMENAPFMPPEILVYPSWNLLGFTSVRGMFIDQYLECLSIGSDKFYGPVWTYYAYNGRWFRNPSWGLWPGEAFWVYYKNNTILANPTIAP
jgi:hypothetical protein